LNYQKFQKERQLMISRLNTINSSPVKFTVGLGLVFLGLIGFGLSGSGFGFNLTSSHPRGFYRQCPESPGRGDYVIFCLAPDHPYIDLTTSRGYLGPGGCPSGLRPLLKQLYGLPGDQVVLSPEGVILNGLLLPGTQRPEFDSQGRELPPSLLVSGAIPDGLGLVLSPDHPGAFDGRHFGLVRLESLKKAKPYITLDF
jgi:conjugative transfer signal peptidase TraF